MGGHYTHVVQVCKQAVCIEWKVVIDRNGNKTATAQSDDSRIQTGRKNNLFKVLHFQADSWKLRNTESESFEQ